MQNNWKQEITSYLDFKNFANNSLDVFKPQLEQLLFPLFLNVYISLKNKLEYNDTSTITKEELLQILNLTDLDKLANIMNIKNNISTHTVPEIFYNLYNEFKIPQKAPTLKSNAYNSFFDNFLSHRYSIVIAPNCSTLLFNFLEQNKLKPILNLINERIDLKNSTNTSLNSINTNINNINNLEEQMNKLETQKTKINIETLKNEIRNVSEYQKRGKDSLVNVLCYSIKNKNVSALTQSKCGRVKVIGYETGRIEVYNIKINNNNNTDININNINNNNTNLDNIVKKDTDLVDININDKNINNNNKNDKNKTENIVYNLIGHTGPIYSLALLPCTTYLLSGGFDGRVRLWCLKLRRVLSIYSLFKSPVFSISINSSGTFFVASGNFKFSVLLGFDSLTPLRVFLSSNNTLSNTITNSSDVYKCLLHPNDSYIFNGHLSEAIMYDVMDGEILRRYRFPRTINKLLERTSCLQVSNDGKLLCVGTDCGSVYLFDIDSQSVLFNSNTSTDDINTENINYESVSCVNSIKFTFDDNKIVIGAEKVYILEINKKNMRQYYSKNRRGYDVCVGLNGVINVLAIEDS